MSDTLEVQFGDRFDQESLNIMQKLESAFLTRKSDDSLNLYPVLNRDSLSMQLPPFLINTLNQQWGGGRCPQGAARRGAWVV